MRIVPGEGNRRREGEDGRSKSDRQQESAGVKGHKES
jgi:hypothetical protein